MTSRAISSWSYDEERHALLVVFPNNSRYEYSLVPKSVVDELGRADSVGHYFVTEVRGKYPERRLD